MPFSALSSTQKITVLLSLAGGPRYTAQVTGAAAATTTLGRATAASGLAMRTASRRTYLMNQALFTLHRYAFLATTVVIGLGVSLVKLGFSYLSALDQARAALRTIFPDTNRLNNELQRLFIISKYSPFVLADMTTAFRKMFPAFHAAGLGVGEINRLIQAMVDTLSFAGKTTPQNLQSISYAFQHMFFQGRLTGRLIQQLSSAGVNVHEILKRLGVQGQNLSNIARLNISPERFTKAFLEVSNLPGVKGAALRLSLESFAGAMQVLRDSVSQFMGLFLSGIYKSGKKELIALVGPGGPLTKLTNIQQTKGNRAALNEFSRMLTGGTGMAGALRFLGKLIKDIGQFFIHIWVPALVQGAKALVYFYPILKTVDTLLVFLNHHTRLAKFFFTLFAGAILLAYGRMLLLWGGGKLLRIMLFDIVAVMRVHVIPALVEMFGVQLAALASSIALWWGLVTATYAEAGALEAVKFAVFAIPVVGWILFAIAALGTLYFKWQWFHDNVNKLVKSIGMFIYNYIIKPIETIRDRLSKVFGKGFLGGVLRGAITHTLGLHFLAGGGKMYKAGPAVVGERGPELLNLPQGATVTPLNIPTGTAVTPSTNANPSKFTNIISAGDNRPQIIQLVVDRRVLAEVVARANQDKLARS